jgi:hypothetical protein
VKTIRGSDRANVFDTRLGLHWSEMTNAERLAAATRFGKVVWDRFNITGHVPSVLRFWRSDAFLRSTIDAGRRRTLFDALGERKCAEDAGVWTQPWRDDVVVDAM